VVSQRDCVRQVLEAEGVARQTRDRQDARDGADGDQELVVAERLVAAVERAHVDLAQAGVGAGEPREVEVRPFELLADRHHHVARLEGARGRAGQERRVEQEVDVGDDPDPRAVAR
jgi:hypothetical protein